MIIKILTEGRTVHELRISTEIQHIRKYQAKITKLNNIITALKISVKGFDIRLDQDEERICELEGRAV